MNRTHRIFGPIAIALLASLVGMVAAQQDTNSASITLDGPALNEPLILQTETTSPIQEGMLVEPPERGSIRLQTENPIDIVPGQLDETEKRRRRKTSHAATIPPTLNPPQRYTETNPRSLELESGVPLFEHDGAERVPDCAAGICPYQRRPSLRAPYPLLPTGYVPYGGMGIDCVYDYYWASRYHFDRRSSYDYYRWFHGFRSLPYQPCPYKVCPSGFDH